MPLLQANKLIFSLPTACMRWLLTAFQSVWKWRGSFTRGSVQSSRRVVIGEYAAEYRHQRKRCQPRRRRDRRNGNIASHRADTFR